MCYNPKVMRRLEILIMALIASSLALFAQTSPQDVIARLERNLASLQSFQADFEQTSYSNSIAIPFREKGRLHFQKPDRMRWEYTSPEPKTFVFKEGLLLSYFPEDNQLWRQKIPPEEYENEILAILAGRARLTEKYKVEPSPFPEAGPDAAQFKLTPKDEGETAYLLLEIDQKSWMIRRVVLFDWANNKNEFAFSRMKINPRMGKDLFEIKVPPDCEIIDGDTPPKK
jgi:outer membrane lipoprotein carrier protein